MGNGLKTHCQRRRELAKTYLHRCETATILVLGRKVHGRRRGCGAVRAASRARVVLRAAPAQTHARVTDGVSLHLVDGHLCSVTLNELNKAASLAGRDFDVSDLAKSLEERAELILGNISGKATDEDGCVVGVGELVHGLGSTVKAHGRSTHGRVHASRTGHAHTTRNNTGALVLRGSCGDAHRTVTAVHSLHFAESTLLVVFVRETDKSVTARHAADGISHDFSGLAGREATLEERDENVFVDLGT